MDKLRYYLENRLQTLSIAEKVNGIVVALAILTLLLLVMSVQSLRLQNAYRHDLAIASTAALNAERVNAAVYAIVMESRGIYMSTDPAKVKQFADAVINRSRDLAALVGEWQGDVLDDDTARFASFKKRILEFIDFRIELARRAVEIGPEAGRKWGDTDANRRTRRALNHDLGDLAAIYAERARSAEELAERGRHASRFLTAFGLGALVLAALNMRFVRMNIIQPLADITRATDEVAAGNLALKIPFLVRRDEIGRLAHAVQNFLETRIQNSELQQREVVVSKARDAAIGQRDSLDDKYNAAKWQLSAAIHNMSQGVVMLDASARILAINQQFRTFYGLPAEIKVGHTLRDIMQQSDGLRIGRAADQLAAMMDRIARREPLTSEVELTDGRVMRICERPMDGGGWVTTHEDLTEERRMQRVLERTERFLVTVIENVAEAIAAKDARSLRYVFVNRAAEKLFDRSRADIMGKTARELFASDIADMIEQGDKRLLDGNEPLEIAVHRVQTPNGQRLHAVRRVPISGPDGESRVFLSMIEDRTDWAVPNTGTTLAA